MKKLGSLILAVLLTFTLAACGASKKSESTANMAAPAAPPMAGGSGQSMDAEYDKSTSAKPAAEESGVQNQNASDEGREIIYTASSSIDVKDLQGSYDSAIAKAKGMGGYIANSSIRNNYAEITVRIPAASLDDYLNYLDTLGGENKSTTISTNDVTDQYTDVQSRLKNLRAHEEQLLLIMKNATTVEDTLKINSELFRVRGEIESYQGRVNMWDKLVELSTVTIRLNKIQEIGGKDVKIASVSISEILNGMSNGFKSTLNFVIRLISGIFILLVSIIPLIPFLGIIAWVVIRFIKKSRKDITK